MRALAYLALFALAAGPASAFEPTGNAIADTLLRSVEQAGYADARVASAERDGDSLVLTGLEGGGAASGKSVRIATATITEPVVNADNDLMAAAIAYEDVVIADAAGEPTATIGAVRLTAVRLPGVTADAPETSDFLGDFDSIAVDGLTARSPEGEEIAFDSLRAALSARDDGTEAGEIALTGLVFGLDLFEEPTAGEIRALGYDSLVVSLEGAGAWHRETGKAELDSARLGIAGMGAVELDGAADGLTPETLAALQTGGLDFARLLEVLGTVSLTTLTVSFEDAGLTDRLIGTLASNSDERSLVVARLVEALAAQLAKIGDPAFAEAALAAVGAFLEEPGRLTLAARPTSEVSALQVIGAAMLNPQLLPGLLSLTITHR